MRNFLKNHVYDIFSKIHGRSILSENYARVSKLFTTKINLSFKSSFPRVFEVSLWKGSLYMCICRNIVLHTSKISDFHFSIKISKKKNSVGSSSKRERNEGAREIATGYLCAWSTPWHFMHSSKAWDVAATGRLRAWRRVQIPQFWEMLGLHLARLERSPKARQCFERKVTRGSCRNKKLRLWDPDAYSLGNKPPASINVFGRKTMRSVISKVPLLIKNDYL